jgi:hypothetical protein
MNSFLPDNYERPAASGGNYAKLEDGQNRFRFLSPAVVGWLYWNTDLLSVAEFVLRQVKFACAFVRKALA